MHLLVKYLMFTCVFNSMATRRSQKPAEQTFDGTTRSPVAMSKGAAGSSLEALTRILVGAATVVALGAVLLWTAFWGSVVWWHAIHGEFVGLGVALVYIALPMVGLAWHFGLGAKGGKAVGAWTGKKAGR